jgi:hypothetical protein
VPVLGALEVKIWMKINADVEEAALCDHQDPTMLILVAAGDNRNTTVLLKEQSMAQELVLLKATVQANSVQEEHSSFIASFTNLSLTHSLTFI